MLEILRESFNDVPVVKRGDYYYFIHPISDGVPALEPELLKKVAEYIVERAPLHVNRILTIEAMGIPLATTVSLMTDIPLAIVRKRKYELEGEEVLSQSTGYSKGELYINGIKKDDRVLIIDDVISTGDTLLSLVRALKNIGAIIAGIFVVIERGEGVTSLRKEGIEVVTLVRIDVDEHGVHILEEQFGR
ncbi:MAG: hypoxanthine/guanine phosphoribosyltransferase [Methanomethylovorans sp.]|uniref:hypoxanthine/guanine phosphoribosyltransferase n=1 Tax=Methanomethylovorans sp. TaxID=2758717 RepID=UPI003C7286CC